MKLFDAYTEPEVDKGQWHPYRKALAQEVRRRGMEFDPDKHPTELALRVRRIPEKIDDSIDRAHGLHKQRVLHRRKVSETTHDRDRVYPARIEKALWALTGTRNAELPAGDAGMVELLKGWTGHTDIKVGDLVNIDAAIEANASATTQDEKGRPVVVAIKEYVLRESVPLLNRALEIEDSLQLEAAEDEEGKDEP